MANTTPRAAKYWDCSPDGEQLRHTAISEAVEDWADSIHPEPLPETVTVYGFAEREIPTAKEMANDILAAALEQLDEEYADPDTITGTEPTQVMKDAALVFANALRAEYDVWMCDEVTSEVVRVADHVPAEWLAITPTTSGATTREG